LQWPVSNGLRHAGHPIVIRLTNPNPNGDRSASAILGDDFASQVTEALRSRGGLEGEEAEEVLAREHAHRLTVVEHQHGVG